MRRITKEVLDEWLEKGAINQAAYDWAMGCMHAGPTVTAITAEPKPDPLPAGIYDVILSADGKQSIRRSLGGQDRAAGERDDPQPPEETDQLIHQEAEREEEFVDPMTKETA